MSKSSRLLREKSFHNRVFGSNTGSRSSVAKYYSVNMHAKERFVTIVSGLCKGNELLEYGCGTGVQSVQWINSGANVTGIDISEEGISKARKRSDEEELGANFYVMDAENTTFDENSFDLVTGNGILHHLDIASSYKELARLCRPEGHIIFTEPMGHNGLLNLFRYLTPGLRTKDEHPLKMQDLNKLKEYFRHVDLEFFSLFTLCAFPFRNTKLFNPVHRLLRAVDDVVLSLPLIKRYSWIVIIHAYHPIDNKTQG